MSFTPRVPWVSYADLLAMPLGDRVKYVRTNLGPNGNVAASRRALGMNQDEFATAVGAPDRHADIRWEKGTEPRDYAERIAALTPYPAEAFLRTEEAGLSLATIDLRLRSLEPVLDEVVGLVRESVTLLREARRQVGEAR